MPLSEQEQRLLDEMERSLYQNDADYVATVGGRRARPNYTVVVVGVLVGVLGIATLVTGVVIQQPLVGVLGFAIMFAGVLTVITPPRRAARRGGGAPQQGQRRRSASFMDNINDRWDRRQEGRE